MDLESIHLPIGTRNPWYSRPCTIVPRRFLIPSCNFVFNRSPSLDWTFDCEPVERRGMVLLGVLDNSFLQWNQWFALSRYCNISQFHVVNSWCRAFCVWLVLHLLLIPTVYPLTSVLSESIGFSAAIKYRLEFRGVIHNNETPNIFGLFSFSGFVLTIDVFELGPSYISLSSILTSANSLIDQSAETSFLDDSQVLRDLLGEAV
jgi:hypothetical protein